MKILLLTAVTFLAFTVAFLQEAKADHIEDRSFLSNEFQKADVATVYSVDASINALMPQQIAELQKISSEQAQIWGDTILEGDYQADGQTTLDQVEELKRNGELIAYKVTYSERAWDTSICPTHHESETASLAACQEGRIRESSFVAPDFKSWARDPSLFAEFEAN